MRGVRMNALFHESYFAYAYDLLTRMVAVNTTNPPGNERELSEFLGAELSSIGAEVSIQDAAEGRANLVARIKGGSDGPVLVLTGHLDTVAANSGWTKEPFQVTRSDGRLFGLGVTDMKGGIAAQIAAVRKLLDTGEINRGELVLCYVADEESRSIGLKKALETLGHADYAVIGEPTELRPAVCHKGVVRMKVTITGKGGHAARPDHAVNPIADIPTVVNAVAEINRRLEGKRHPLLGCGTAVITVVRAGDKGNQIPSACEMKIDRRLLPGETAEQACAEIAEQLTTAFAGKHTTFSLVPYLSTGSGSVPEESEIVQTVSEACQRLFGHQTCVAFDGCCEQTFWEAAGVDTVIFGPGSLNQAHAADESIEESQLYDAVGGYYEIVRELLGKETVPAAKASSILT